MKKNPQNFPHVPFAHLLLLKCLSKSPSPYQDTSSALKQSWLLGWLAS